MTGVPDRKDVLNQACKPQMHVFILGCISLGKILILILKTKTDFLFLWQNPKKDYESNESVFLEFKTFVFLWERIRRMSIC